MKDLFKKIGDVAGKAIDPAKRLEKAAEIAGKVVKEGGEAANVLADNKNNRWVIFWLTIFLVLALAITYKVFTNSGKINSLQQQKLDAGCEDKVELWKGFYTQEKHEKDSLIKAKAMSDSIVTAQTAKISRLDQIVEFFNKVKK